MLSLRTNCKPRSQRHRHGVTLMEVMFATGIVMIGLLGVASLLPIANRQANDSYIITSASSVGQNWYRTLLARKLHTPSAGQPWLVPNDAGGFFRADSIGVAAVNAPIDLHENANANALGFCIDPLFWSGNSAQSYDPSGNVTAFRASTFPYFTPRYNPLTLPTLTATHSWNFQPRLLRVTFPSLAGGTVPLAQKVVDEVFSTVDDLVLVKDEADQSLNVVLGVQPNAAGALGKLALQKQLTWIATLTPSEVDSSDRPLSYTLSVVVFNKRDRGFLVPVNMDDLIDPPDDERVALVLPTSAGKPLPGMNSLLNVAFSGGNGFDVALIGAEYGKRKVKVGSWVMLSRKFTFEGSTNVRHVHKWFRVTSSNSEDSKPTSVVMIDYSLPGLAGDYWMQNVHLMGPDWIFQQFPNGLPQPQNQPTVATIVPDVVAVYERMIEVK